MEPTFRHLVVGLMVAASALAIVPGRANAQSAEQANRLLSAWQMTEAKSALDAIARRAPGGTDLVYLRARYEFFSGQYDRAAQRLDQALANGASAGGSVRRLRDRVEATRQVTKDYQKHTTPKGRFEIYVPPGKDQVLVPFAAEALDRAYDEIGDALGYRPATPIRVEVYPRTATLAKVSSLSDKDIRTSGTIALCKYNRLMITSPKALLRGYGWVDTVVHEYVHYVINAKTHNPVPIWMHEGLAKYLERRWRGPNAQRLPPSSQHLLKKRVQADDLITFEQMHPSMAKLPSQEDASVAFAEVYTVMEYLRKQVGERAFEHLLDAINDGLGARAAFARTVGKPFETFETEWTAYLKDRDMADVPEDNGYEDKLVFKEDQNADSEVNDIDQPGARDHMHLGEMLQGRKRPAAALVEYRKAARLLGDQNPVLQTRQAQCLLQNGQPKEALGVLEPVRQTYPGYVQAWVELGKAAVAVGEYDRARRFLREAARINPFDPEIHATLAHAYEKLGNAKMAKKFRKFKHFVN